MGKLEIRQIDGEHGIFTEVLIDGHKVDGVRRFELKQGVGDSVPTLTLDLNALDLAVDLSVLIMKQDGIGEIEEIKFKTNKNFNVEVERG